MAWQPSYATAAQLKGLLGITGATDDTALGFALTAASRAIDHHCNRQFGKLDAAAPRYYEARWDADRCRYVVDIEDLMSTTNLVVKTDDGTDTFDTTLTLNDDYRLAPYNAAADVRPWTSIVAASGVALPTRERCLEVTALWGWAAVPGEVLQACLLQAGRIFKRKDAPFGILGSPQTGSEIRLLSKLDPDVAVLLSSVVRWWGAA